MKKKEEKIYQEWGTYQEWDTYFEDGKVKSSLELLSEKDRKGRVMIVSGTIHSETILGKLYSIGRLNQRIRGYEKGIKPKN